MSQTLVRLRPLHKFLHKKLRIPRRFIRPVLSPIKVVASRGEHAERVEIAQRIRASSPHAADIPDERGYRTFGASEIPGIEPAIERCETIFKQVQYQEAANGPRADFLRSVASSLALTSQPELLGLMVSRPILDAAASYLRCLPILTAADLLWSPVNDSRVSSQLFHLDDEDDRQVKLFINVREVTTEHGPFTFLPADTSSRIQKLTGNIISRADDARVLGASDRDPIQLCGAPGSGGFVDTGRCLHYGSRNNVRERLVLSFQFLRDDAPSEPPTPCAVPQNVAGLVLDPVQRRALRCQGA